MQPFLATALATGLLVLAGCGSDAGPGTAPSGVTGRVTLGPTCAVESAETPCEDQPPVDVAVTVSEALPGEAYAVGPTVARGTTDAEGVFRIQVPPGAYVVTARAGMFCELMDVLVVEGTFANVTVPCDTGIR